ncbi:hypothetical protein CPB83DRAFT_836265 [Crepidotus variabilis]|uniref:Uncharacterized protein n=1 Tax=Crepidotus variabilis TaxID=179855 RepID=A0A9P6EFE1_9AGAR|nr:hypothetical protein CPB83DRAFT_836265 [Crepidotus variabilis]
MQPRIPYLLYLQLCTPLPVARVDLSGKHVVVVGASGGLGLEAAKHFASMNLARLILACRDQNRGEAAVAKIIRETEFKNVELWLSDLTDFSSVNVFAEKYEKEGGRLDLLAENAAIIPVMGQQMTRDGWEPAMLETGEKYCTIPRLVVVSSGVHYFTTLEDRVTDAQNPFQVFGAEDYWDMSLPKDRSKRYFDTKLLNVLFARALAGRLVGQSIVVDAVDPGYCKSNLRGGFRNPIRIISRFFDFLFALSTEQGSRQLVWASVARTPGGEEIDLNGQFISFSSVTEPSDYVLSEQGHLELMDGYFAWSISLMNSKKLTPRFETL